MESSVQIVWLKRDLRVSDHGALQAAAATKKPLMLLYVFEPSIMQAPDYDIRHARFIWQSLMDIQDSLPIKTGLWIVKGEMPEVLQYLESNFKIEGLYSHQETGNGLSYKRDLLVAHWCKKRKISWKEFSDRGIIRGLKKRNNWPEQFYACLNEPIIENNLKQIDWVTETSCPFLLHSFSDLFPNEKPINEHFQPGGTSRGLQYLHGFLQKRGIHYQKHISKPTEARTSCGRLSPYLAYGCLSLKQVYQTTKKRMAESSEMKRPLHFFLQRLRWHSHFIQKMETRPALEFENIHPGFNELRTEVNASKVEAWKEGRTGFPMVDACMICVRETGYLNFRMRAMLVSFLTHHLWQPWQSGVHHLAKYFLDYEPGIHFAQFQMQAGVTGINTIRIYNPVKQGQDHDPHGVFVKKWLPSLQNIPEKFIHTPWLLTAMEQIQYGCTLGMDYPKPVADLEIAAKYARENLWKQKGNTKGENTQIILQTLSGRKTAKEKGA